MEVTTYVWPETLDTSVKIGLDSAVVGIFRGLAVSVVPVEERSVSKLDIEVGAVEVGFIVNLTSDKD